MKEFIKKNKRKIQIIAVALIVLALVYYFIIDVILIFSAQEKTMREAAEKYYETTPRELKEEGVSTISLQKLYDEEWITESMYTPHTTQLCNAETSWVKVRKENDEYKYYVYLECGDIRSNVDYQGPEITLNGKDEITIDLGGTYEEEGVKKVVDNVDGELKIEDVKVTHNIDTSVIGIYEVKYTIKDSLDNQTTVIRTVNVAESLASIIKTDTQDKNYYQGDKVNNYVLFSGNLFQIVSMNDESIKLIAAEQISYVDYTTEKFTFEDSTVQKWLNDYYYEHISEESKEYMVPSTYCIDKIDIDNPINTSCNEYTKEKYNVGLIAVDEFNRSLLEDGFSTYLQNDSFGWLINLSTDNLAVYNSKYFNATRDNNYRDDAREDNGGQLLGVKPVITIKNNVVVVDGVGTPESPYKLEDYTYGESGQLLNSRLTGEYLEYSDYLFRIKEVNEDGSINIIQQDAIKTNEGQVLISYNSEDSLKVYNPNETGNVAYIIENDTDNYFKTDLLVKKDYEVIVYNNKASYGEGTIKTYNLMFSAPSMFDMYSAQDVSIGTDEYWLSETSKEEGRKYASVYEGNILNVYLDNDFSTGIKIETTLNSEVKIVEGNGTKLDPYQIR